jgi:hypothetical protein
MNKENPFKHIGQPQKGMPEEIKEGVLQNINTAKSLMEMSENFNRAYKAAMSALFKTINNTYK